ncbi:hypothetical protein AHAS_Ahas17G0004300 [Arachis hypogaea]
MHILLPLVSNQIQTCLQPQKMDIAVEGHCCCIELTMEIHIPPCFPHRNHLKMYQTVSLEVLFPQDGYWKDSRLQERSDWSIHQEFSL